jgi:hypothetical protein
MIRMRLKITTSGIVEVPFDRVERGKQQEVLHYARRRKILTHITQQEQVS